MGIKTIVICDICEREVDEGEIGMWFYKGKRFTVEPLVEDGKNFKCICMNCSNFIKENLE